jgi:hypothetical protein
MVADGFMALAFGLVAPIALASGSRNSQAMLITSAAFLLGAAFWFDLVRTIWRFQKKLPLK